METKRKRIDSGLINTLADDAGLSTGEFIARLITLYQLMPFNSYLIRVIEMFPNLTALVSTISLWSRLDRDHVPLPIMEDDINRIISEPEPLKEPHRQTDKIKI